MSDELKPCPFCGSVMETKYYANMGYIVYCTNEDDCPGNMEFWETEREAITAWNTRPIEDELRAKWDAIPWEEIANGCKAATRHGMWVTADALIDWFAANAPEEEGE